MKFMGITMPFVASLFILPVFAGSVFSSGSSGSSGSSLFAADENLLTVDVENYENSAGLQATPLMELGTEVVKFSKEIEEGISNFDRYFTNLDQSIEKAQNTEKGKLVRNDETGQFGGSSQEAFARLQETIFSLPLLEFRLPAKNVWGFRKRTTGQNGDSASREPVKTTLLFALADFSDTLGEDEGRIDVRAANTCFDWIFNPVIDLRQDTVTYPKNSKKELSDTIDKLHEVLQVSVEAIEVVEQIAMERLDPGIFEEYLAGGIEDILKVWRTWEESARNIKEYLSDIKRVIFYT